MSLLTRSKTPPPLPTSIDAHPLVVQAVQRRQELTAKFAAAEADHARLLTERTRLTHTAHESQVAELLGDSAPPSDELMARLIALEAAIAGAVTHLATMQDALERLTERERSAREQATAELKAQVRAATREIVEQQAQWYKHIDSLMPELYRLHEIGVWPVSPALFVYATTRAHWRAAAAELGVDV